jgi:hypothetical protein
MSKNYRLRTTPGIDKNIRIKVDQDFDFIEILSLKLKQEDVYTRFCADYGVVAGRVIANGGYGVPNVSVSVFVPLSVEDSEDPVISTLYPYKSLTEKNEDGYRYNLLPYVQEYGGHNPTGTFPDREDVVSNSTVLEVYEKYYKYTVRTNESGDFMIVGVPLGQQIVVMDMDLSNIGCFSLRPSDLIRMGMGSEGQFEGSSFKSSSDLDSLPQIVNEKKEVEVTSFWGDDELCNIGITRVDFDLRDLGIQIEPQAIFMGSMFSTTDEDALQTNCKPKFDTGNLCDLVSAPGTILAIRQTIFTDVAGYPILEQYKLPEGGNIIDNEGTWLIEMPMNLDYITTNEFGEQVISNDPKVGIPTKAKYRFKIQYQNEGFAASTQRADYLVPNIREYGWGSNINANGPANDTLQRQSYTFSLDWTDYGDTGTTIGQKMIADAINCEDKFFEFNYNRVYTVSSFIDRWKWGFNRSRHLGIKEITNRECSTTTNRMPVNDGVRNFDLIFFLFNLIITIFSPLAFVLIPLIHVIAKFWPIARWALAIGVPILLAYFTFYMIGATLAAFPAVGLMVLSGIVAILLALALTFYIARVIPLMFATANLKGIVLPSITYPDCEACSCESNELNLEEIIGDGTSGTLQTLVIRRNDIYTRKNSSFLCDTNSNAFWDATPNEAICIGDGGNTPSANDCNDNDDQLPFCGLRTDNFDGGANLERQKYQLNSYGIKYAIAGYPNLKVKGTPISRLFFPNGLAIFQQDITWAQTLNLANVRQRYFQDVSGFKSQNIITTTVENDGYPSQPFTDNVMVLVCDPNTNDSYPAGSLLTFNNPENIDDKNVNGFNVSGQTENQFGSKSITGTTLTSTTVTLYYIDQFGNTQPANIYLTGSSTERTYNFKGGIEYFQVITGMTMGTLSSSFIGNGFIKTFIRNPRQRIFYRKSCNNENHPNVSSLINPMTIIGDPAWRNLTVLFLVRGVDPFTEKQIIKYDLSKLFNYNYPANAITVKGRYYLNVPIQPNSGDPSKDWWINKKTPESHEVPYQFSKLYHKPFNFRPDPNLFSAFTTNTIKYYSALDRKMQLYGGFKSFPGDNYGINNALTVKAYNSSNPTFYDTGLTDWTTNQTYRICYIDTNGAEARTIQGNVEGGSLLYTNITEGNYSFEPISNGNGTIPGLLRRQQYSSETNLNNYLDGDSESVTNLDLSNFNRPRLFSPAYYIQNPTLNETITFDNNVDNARMIIRSDRLPTSDSVQTIGNNGYTLYHNDNLSIYRILDTGEVIQLGGNQTDYTGNSDDYAEDAISGTTSVLATFSCEGMVPLPCYSGSGDNFGVKSPCPENENPTRIYKGCYKLIQEPYLTNGAILRDYNNFFEWKSRFRLLFGACRGVISHVFQNNWVNGTLYSYAFKKKTIFDAQNNPKKYIFCGSKEVDLVPGRQNQGPIYLDDQTNTFYYRSTPYVLQQNGTNVTGYFIGQEPRSNGAHVKQIYGRGVNQRNLHFPTTLMDLGPRDQFAKEICLNPQLENYLVETIQSTSFNDTSDLLLLFIISRLVNTGFWELALSRGDASINQLFSRSDDRIDGDVAQMFSINSEYGIIPFNEQFYGNDDIVLGTPNEIFYGVLFSAITQNRVALTPGVATFGNIQQLVGYPKTQVVPMYNWEIRNDQGQATINTSTIFGTEKNDWLTDIPLNTNQMYSVPYQNMSFTGADYFKATNGPSTGYIFNYNNLGERDYLWQNNSNQTKANFVVGAPYHFYFGLGKGKTALNRFITKYIIGTE